MSERKSLRNTGNSGSQAGSPKINIMGAFLLLVNLIFYYQNFLK